MGPILTPSIRRVINNIRQVGPKRASCLARPLWCFSDSSLTRLNWRAEAWRDLQYIGDFKAGQLMGSDE